VAHVVCGPLDFIALRGFGVGGCRYLLERLVKASEMERDERTPALLTRMCNCFSLLSFLLVMVSKNLHCRR
jgi:hypothetical protein